MASKVMNVRHTSTKRALINAFSQLVAKKDFEKITIADITTGAQVNRATFYAHFNDKYELLDYMMGNSASAAILNRTAGGVKFDRESIHQLVLAVCDYYHQPDIPCKSSYIGLVVPQLKEKVVNELTAYLSKSLENVCTEEETKLYVPIAAQAIHEGALQWTTGKIMMEKEEAAKRVALFVMGGFDLLSEKKRIDSQKPPC